MSDLFVVSPRRVEAWIKIHPAELTHVVCQDAILHAFTEEELKKMASAIETEIRERDPSTPK